MKERTRIRMYLIILASLFIIAGGMDYEDELQQTTGIQYENN